jgi:hypothetical protein
MSLPTRQERILGRMAQSLRASEPRLTSMFAMFTKLARDEDMPRPHTEPAPSRPRSCPSGPQRWADQRLPSG